MTLKDDNCICCKVRNIDFDFVPFCSFECKENYYERQRKVIRRMTMKLTRSQRDHLKQLIIECELQRFNTVESLNYIESKLKHKISDDHFFTMKRRVREEAGSRLAELMESKDAYMLQHFDRIDELKYYQKELWSIYRKYPNRPEVQKNCLTELRELTVLLGKFYDLIPDYVGLKVPLDIPVKPPFQDEVVRTTKSLKEQEFEDEAIF